MYCIYCITCHHGRVRPLVTHSLSQQAAICPGLCFDELLHKVVDHCQLSRCQCRRSSLISFCLYFVLQHSCHQVCFCISVCVTKVLEPPFADLRVHKTLYTKFFQDTFIRSFVSPFNTKQSSVKPHFCCLDSVFIILS